MKFYFARPINLYNTPQDYRDLLTLAKLGLDIINPNKEELAQLYRKLGMNIFLDLIKSEECDGVIFRSFPDGKISAGVWKEIQEAKAQNKIIIELPNLTSSRQLSVEDTREYLSLLGQR